MHANDPHNTTPGDLDEGGPETTDHEPRFPVIVLAAPGFIFTLFVVMADALAASLESVRLAMIVALAAAGGAVACFSIIAAKSSERHVRVGAGLGAAAAVFALGVAILRLT